MRHLSTLSSLLITGSLICGSVPTLAHAGTLESMTAPEAAEDPALTQARALYKDGEVKFQTADYEDALALWKEAFRILPDGEDTRTMRHALVYNIAEAHRRAYEVSRNPTHLRKAKILLENYRAEHLQLFGDDKAAVKERAEVDDRIAELDKMIAASEAANETATPLDDGGAGTVQPGPGQPVPQPEQPMPQPQQKPMTPQQQWEATVKADPNYGPMWIKGGKQVGGGIVLISIGSVFAIIGGVLIWWGVNLRNTPNEAGFIDFNGTGSLVAGGVFGVAGLGMIIPGALMVGTGAKKRKDVQKAYPKPTASFAPTMIRRGAGFGVTLRF